MESQVSAPSAPPWWRRLIVGKNPKTTAIRLLISVALILIVFQFILVPIRIVGHSMEPTYVDGRVNFVNRLAYLSSMPQRGDVVAIQRREQNLTFLKRIVALPGERVAIVAGVVFINGQPLDEPYVRIKPSKKGAWAFGEVTVDEGYYFVIGDNRGVSDFGNVRMEQILGKVLR